MTGCYRISTNIKSPNHYIEFPQGLYHKLSRYVWGDLMQTPVDPRWVITGVAQPGITSKSIGELDYLAAFMSIPIFSIKASEVIKRECPDDVEFVPCKVVVDDALHDFMIARIFKFLPLIDQEATARGQKISVFAPDILNANMKDVYLMARDVENPTTLICSSEFRDLCNSNKLNIKFSEVEDFNNWLARQPIKTGKPGRVG